MKLLVVESTEPTEERVIRRPTIKITEMWGKTQNGDRDVMEALMRNIEGATVKAKIKSVNEFMKAEGDIGGREIVRKNIELALGVDVNNEGIDHQLDINDAEDMETYLSQCRGRNAS